MRYCLSRDVLTNFEMDLIEAELDALGDSIQDLSLENGSDIFFQDEKIERLTAMVKKSLKHKKLNESKLYLVSYP